MGRLRVLRSMFIPGALHGIEASFLAGTSLRKLRAAIFWGCVVSSAAFLLILVLFLACLMVLQVVILPFVLSGFVFVCFEGIWLYRRGEVFRVYRLLEQCC